MLIEFWFNLSESNCLRVRYASNLMLSSIFDGTQKILTDIDLSQVDEIKWKALQDA